MCTLLKAFYRWMNVNPALRVKESALKKLAFAKSGFLDLANFSLNLAFNTFWFLY